MHKNTTQHALPAVKGKVIASAFVINDSPEAHGVLFVFEDGSEMSINFDYQTRVNAEILHYRWNDGEATILEKVTVS